MAYNTVNDLFKAIADAIRTKTGKSEKIATQDMPAEIESITTGGGDEWTITNVEYLAYQNPSLIENMDIFLNHIDFSKDSSIVRFYDAGTGGTILLYPKHIKRIFGDEDFQNRVATINNSFGGPQDIESDEVIDIKIPKCISLGSVFNNIGRRKGYGYLTFDFHGSTNNVKTFASFLTAYSSWTKCVKAILNFSMDSATGAGCLTGHSNATRLTFDGSFGGSSTTASLTLDLSGWTKLTVEAFLETMTTISANTNGNTRIFKLPSTLYNALTDEILDLADEKGYTLSS